MSGSNIYSKILFIKNVLSYSFYEEDFCLRCASTNIFELYADKY